jgi:multidrug transporter EmrE-like cation transporter
MDTVAFALVITSAFAHAGWNFLLKRSEHKIGFLWSAGGVAVAIMVVPAIVFAFVDEPGWRGVGFSGERGDPRRVRDEPVPRVSLGSCRVCTRCPGDGAALVPLSAVFLFDEHVSLVAGIGIGLIVFGIYAIHSTSGCGGTYRTGARPQRLQRNCAPDGDADRLLLAMGQGSAGIPVTGDAERVQHGRALSGANAGGAGNGGERRADGMALARPQYSSGRHARAVGVHAGAGGADDKPGELRRAGAGGGHCDRGVPGVVFLGRVTGSRECWGRR